MDDGTRGDAVQGQRRPGNEVAFPDAGRAVVQVAAVAGRREIVTTIGDRRADRLGDDAVLEGRRQQIPEVVDDDVGASRAEILDVLRHLRRPVDAGREEQLSARREVVDDLEYGRPLGALALLRPQANGIAPPACPGRTVTPAGTSPVACCAASASTPSESTPTLMPVPSTSCVLRATFAWWATSPSLRGVLLLTATIA